MKQFAKNHSCDVILLMGMHIAGDGSVRRDLGIVPINSTELAERITRTLTESREPNLNLIAAETSLATARLFNQINIRASRKQILPIVQGILDDFE